MRPVNASHPAIAGLSRAHALRGTLDLSTDTARALPVVLPVAIAGAAGIIAAIVALIANPLSTGAVFGTLGLLAAAALAEAFPVPIEGVTVGLTSLATVFIVAAASLYNWKSAAVVGFLTMVIVELGRRRALVRVVYNTGLYVCAAIAAGFAASLVSNRTDLAPMASRALLGSTAFYLIDIGLLSVLGARVREMRLAASARRYVMSTSFPFLIIASLTVALVVVWQRSPWVSFVLVGPLITFALYERSLHRTLDRLREFDRLKDEFIAVISHELRTPLTSVYGAAVTLREQKLAEELRETLLAVVSDEAGRLARLLDDALAANRLDAGRETFEISPVDGAAVAAGVVEAGRPRAPAGVTLELAVDDGLPPVAADEDKLRQVLVNLLENAIKYSPEGGRVEVRLERTGRVVRFGVADEGIGIPAREQARIFDKFHRLDPHMTRGVGGTGLGLYICRELVERMGGRIWVSSVEGGGSTFTFELPVAG